MNENENGLNYSQFKSVFKPNVEFLKDFCKKNGCDHEIIEKYRVLRLVNSFPIERCDTFYMQLMKTDKIPPIERNGGLNYILIAFMIDYYPERYSIMMFDIFKNHPAVKSLYLESIGLVDKVRLNPGLPFGFCKKDINLIEILISNVNSGSRALSENGLNDGTLRIGISFKCDCNHEFVKYYSPPGSLSVRLLPKPKYFIVDCPNCSRSVKVNIND